MTTRYWCEMAWLGGPRATPGVVIDVRGDRIVSVASGHASPPRDAIKLSGLTLPALANAHSHAFHRALRGRTHGGQGTFWTWRDLMYGVARQPRSGELLPARSGDLRRDGPGGHRGGR